MAETQKAYLHGTIEFYQARTNTKMTIAAERLAVVAAVTGIAMAALPNSSSLGVAIRVSLMTESFRRRTSGEVVVSVGGRCRRPLHVVPADRPLGP